MRTGCRWPFAADRPFLLPAQGLEQKGVGPVGSEAIGQQQETPAGIERRIELPMGQELLDGHGLVVGWTQGIQVGAVHDDMLVWGVLIALDNVAILHRAMDRAKFLLTDALAAPRMKLMEFLFVFGGDQGIGFDRHDHLKKLQDSGPACSAGRVGGNRNGVRIGRAMVWVRGN
jgi:hypothetical protein